MDPQNAPQKLIGPTVAPMFDAPDPLSEQVSQALMGMPVREEEASGEWRRVQTPDGYRGWIDAAALVDPPEAWSGPWAEADELWVNFRPVKSSRTAAVTRATIGTVLPLVGREEGWVELLLPDGRQVWTESSRMRELEQAPPRPASARALCRTARRFLGVPYLWGGCSPLGIDCSGFVQLVYRLHGFSLLRDAHQQAGQGRAAEAPEAADLVYFGPEAEPKRITHVGMMLDSSRFIHALGSQCVRINRLSDPPFDRRFRFARRYLEEPSAVPGNGSRPGRKP